MGRRRRVTPPCPRLTEIELLAMARLLRAYAGVEKFATPLTACLAKDVALRAAAKVHAWAAELAGADEEDNT
jgi:hypothetical protein